ncbi:MAG: NAD(P)-dependent oxidoreductase [Candidatus Coatesbacteria bacterium]
MTPDLAGVRVALTGATGFLGGHLAAAFARAGASLAVLARPASDLSRIEGLRPNIVRGSLADEAALAALARGARIFVHNAGVVQAPDFETYLRVNRDGTAAAARAAGAAGVETFIYISSQAATGPVAEGAPARREDDPPDPRSWYGKSKREGELAIIADGGAITRRVFLRPGALYGPADRAFLAYFKLVRLRLKPQLGDGLRRFQILYGPDVADAALCALRAPAGEPRAYYIVPPEPETYRSFGAAIERAMGRRALTVRAPAFLLHPDRLARIPGLAAVADRFHDFHALRWHSDPSRAREELGWTASTPLESGLKLTWDWYRANRWA